MMWHLISRLLRFLAAKPLLPREQLEVYDVLAPELRQLFFRQRHEDQRHALAVKRWVEGVPELYEAALLHDVGKTESDLGAVARAFATVWHGSGMQARSRWRSYINHGAIGADLIEDRGASALAVAFTRHHPGPTPTGIRTDSWNALGEADERG